MGTKTLRQKFSKTNENITIRVATVDDVLQLRSLMLEVSGSSHFLKITQEEYSSLSLEQQVNRIKRLTESNGDLWLIAEYNHEIIGSIDFQNGKNLKTTHKGSFGLIIKPNWQNKGVGKILLSELIEWVKDHPLIEVINLTVAEENIPAVLLYKKIGFQITGREPYSQRSQEGNYIVDLSMTLKI